MTPPPHARHILLENTSTGARAIWVVSSGAIVNSGSLGTMPTSWQIVASGDFNADGFDDIVWENTGPGANGSRAIWLMNGSGGVLAAASLGVVDLKWRIAGARDYDANGKDDILLESTGPGGDGTRVHWLMNGGRVERAVVMGTLSVDWHMVAASDLNSDGNPDILLENSTSGNKVLWIMSGGSPQDAVLLGTIRWNGSFPQQQISTAMAAPTSFYRAHSRRVRAQCGSKMGLAA